MMGAPTGHLGEVGVAWIRKLKLFRSGIVPSVERNPVAKIYFEIKPAKGQVPDLLERCKERVESGERVPADEVEKFHGQLLSGEVSFCGGLTSHSSFELSTRVGVSGPVGYG